ncbi:hypothetical protein [Tomitella gaofuii]|uniref:hypothetical protein n=1 Tax=Tomitella gaofuii TaxID=2760083 RepID=UPI0015FB3A05|nr:hypothetical protein [Tomitella gaofuii]
MGDAADDDFWARLVRSDTVRIVVLAMRARHTDIDALDSLRSAGYGDVTVAAVASYRANVEELGALGFDRVVRLYDGAGETLAGQAVIAVRPGEPV